MPKVSADLSGTMLRTHFIHKGSLYLFIALVSGSGVNNFYYSLVGRLSLVFYPNARKVVCKCWQGTSPRCDVVHSMQNI